MLNLVMAKTVSESYDVPTSGTKSWTLKAPNVDGYTPIGCVGWNYNYCLQLQIKLEGGDLSNSISGYIDSHQNIRSVQIKARFLYIRA